MFDSAGNPLALWYSQATLNAIGSFYPAIPQLTQGVGDFQRIGNVVQPTSVGVSLKIGLNPVSVDVKSLYVVIYYGVSKAYKTWANGSPVQTAAILDNGDGTNVAWAGVRGQLNIPTDKKMYTLRRKIIKLSKTEGVQNGDVNPAAVKGNYATSNGNSCKNTFLKFKLPASLKYNQAGDRYPQNFAPFFGVGFCHADGSPLTIPGDDQQLVNIESRCHMYFKDA